MTTSLSDLFDLDLTVTFNTRRKDVLADVLGNIAKEGHFDSLGDLCFALIGPCAPMGYWGVGAPPTSASPSADASSGVSIALGSDTGDTYSAPLLFPVDFGKNLPESPATPKSVDGGEPAAVDYQSTVVIKASSVPKGCLITSTVPTDANNGSSNTTTNNTSDKLFIECRLAVYHLKYGCVVGIDNAFSDPTLVEVVPASAHDGAAGAVSFTFSPNVAGGEGGLTWQSDVLTHRDKPLPSCHIISTGSFRAINSGSKGPYLNLIFYPHRNDLPFDASQWLQSLPAEQQEAFRERRHTCRLRLTKASLMESSFVNWSAFDGSASRARAGLANCVAPSLSNNWLETGNNSFSACLGAGGVNSSNVTNPQGPSGFGGADFIRRGCPVPEPLRVVEPVRDATAKGIRDNATMVSWTVTYDLSLLTNHIPVIEFEGFSKDANEGHKGSFCLLPDMFMLRDQTNGASGVAAISDDKQFAGPIFMNYTVIRPFQHEKNNYRCVRSVESFQKLHYKTVMGHRGLGKTFTDSVTTQKFRAQKFTENTVASFCAAHKRGAGAIEFDVMMTSDQVPVVIHEPVFTVETPTAEGHHMEQTEVYLHQLTRRRLDALVKECLPASADVQYRLKTMLEHHWRSILEMARGRPFGGGFAGSPESNLLALSNHHDGGAEEARGEGSSAHVNRNIAAKDRRSLLIQFGMTPITTVREERRLNLVDQTPFISRTPAHRDKHIGRAVPTLADVIQQTPPSLGYNLEVKFPFQPKADRNLHLQSDAFEINKYCDLILEVIYQHAFDQKREIGFSSFDPDICTAMMLKQNRYHVLFLADCAERVDLKDYRSWGVEAPIQFAMGARLAGVSIPSRSLLRPRDLETVLRNKVVMPKYRKDAVEVQEAARDDADLSTVDAQYPQGIVRVCNNRGLHVWTWGGANDNMVWCDLQKASSGVTGVITDNIPPPALAGEM